MGRLADRAGQKRGFIAGMILFIAASLACGFAPGIWWLVGFRVLQAVGAAAMTPASLGLLIAAVAPEKRASAARLWAMTGAVAAALGPALGGGLVQLSWQWAFWINLPIGVLLVLGAIRYVPDVRHNEGTPLPGPAGSPCPRAGRRRTGSRAGPGERLGLDLDACARRVRAVRPRDGRLRPTYPPAPLSDHRAGPPGRAGVPLGQPRHARLQQRVRCRPPRGDPVAAAGLGVRRPADRPGDRARAGGRFPSRRSWSQRLFPAVPARVT